VIKTAAGIYLHYIDGYLKELGFDSALIFRGAGLTYPDYIQSGERVSLQVIANLIEHVNTHTLKPDFVLQLGRRIPLMAHGNLGAAMLACKDLRTLLVLSERFSRLAFSSITLSVKDQGNNIAFKIHADTGFPILDIAIMDAILGTAMENLQRLSGVHIQPIHVSIRHKKPRYHEFYNVILQCPIEFEAPDNELIFSKKHMALPLQTADNLGGDILVEKCREDLKEIDQGSPFITRITDIITSHLSASPSLLFVADTLQISERTLRRRLAEENINYRDLIKNIRHKKALYFLQHTQLRIEKIAWELGYRETANFRRAFKETTGKSPRDWRKSETVH